MWIWIIPANSFPCVVSVKFMMHSGCPDVIGFGIVMFIDHYRLRRWSNRWRHSFDKTLILAYLDNTGIMYRNALTGHWTHYSFIPILRPWKDSPLSTVLRVSQHRTITSQCHSVPQIMAISLELWRFINYITYLLTYLLTCSCESRSLHGPKTSRKLL